MYVLETKRRDHETFIGCYVFAYQRMQYFKCGGKANRDSEVLAKTEAQKLLLK